MEDANVSAARASVQMQFTNRFTELTSIAEEANEQHIADQEG
jgi:hypothetical protein